MHAKETTNTADSVDPIAGNHNVGVNNNNINNNGDPSLGQENPQHGSLFVGDLSIFCTEADMQEAFQPHGEIVEVKVMRCDETHKNLCYGFVKFSNQEDAQRAMDALNSSLLCGRPMRYVRIASFAWHCSPKSSYVCLSMITESAGRPTKRVES